MRGASIGIGSLCPVLARGAECYVASVTSLSRVWQRAPGPGPGAPPRAEHGAEPGAATGAEPGATRARQSGAPGRPTLSDRLPRPWLFPLLVFAGTWVVILATWYISDAIYGHSEPWTFHFLFKDAYWFLDIAEHGYPARVLPQTKLPSQASAFFPLFPALIRLLGYVAGGNDVVGGLIVMILTGAASALGVWTVAARVRDRWVADRAVVLYCLFPGAFTFGWLYSEPLTVAIVAGVLLALLDRRWLLAGILGALATAEESKMIILVGVSGIAALQAIWARREWRALIAPVLTPLGLLAFFGYLGHRYRDYGFWFKVEHEYWGVHLDWGQWTLHLLLFNYQGVHKVLGWDVMYVILLLAAVAGIIMTLTARLPLPLWLYSLLLVLSITLAPANPRARYILTAFPLFIGAAAKLPRAVYYPLLAVSAACLVFLIGWWPHHYYDPAP